MRYLGDKDVDQRRPHIKAYNRSNGPFIPKHSLRRSNFPFLILLSGLFTIGYLDRISIRDLGTVILQARFLKYVSDRVEDNETCKTYLGNMLFPLGRLVIIFAPSSRPRLIFARPSLALALIVVPIIPVPLIPRAVLVPRTVLGCRVPVTIGAVLVVPGGALVAAAAAAATSIGAGG